MDHPHIARVFDGGETPDGHPYFVMELVEGGVPITEYCAARGLGLEERLRLFVPVCDAVDHAHRKRIIHRDLKPSNVLVTEDAGQAQVKVIDFGIAKPLEEQWASATHATVIGELVGTPEYMSPEQAALGAVDIDTRSDVFTLGLLLYELIVGDLPLPSKELRRLPFDELCRRIREDDTPLPSTMLRRARVTAGGETGPRPSTLSGTWRRVQGDLDRILAKALAKDREQRYGSAAELGDDLERFLAFEPVRATPPSRVYRFKKFVRRNRVGVAAATFLVVGLMVGLAVALVGFRRASMAEQEALASLAALRSSEQFLVGLFQGATPGESLGEDPPASELLERGIARLAKLDDQPEVKARLLGNLGEVQRQRGEYRQAEELHRQALDLYDTVVQDPVQQAISGARLGALHRRRSELREAEALFRSALEVFEEHAPDHQSYGATLNELAMVLNDTGQFDAATEAYDRLIEMHRGNPKSPPVALPSVLFNAAVNQADGGNAEAAIESLMEALPLFRKVWPAGHPSFGPLHNTLAVWHKRLGLLDCARRHTEIALAIDRKVLPPTHPHLGDTLLAAAELDGLNGDFPQANGRYAEARSIYVAAMGEGAERVGIVDHNLALLMLAQGRFAEAATALAELFPDLEARNETPSRNRELAADLRLLALALREQALVLKSPDDENSLASSAQQDSLLEQAHAALERAEEAAQREGAGIERIAIKFQRALLSAQRGEVERAWEFYEEAVGLGATEPMTSLDNPSIFQFRAQLPALLGEADRAFEWAEEALAHPKRSLWIVTAPEMQLLRDDARFAALEGRLRDRMAGGSQTCRGLPTD
jgi:non-specific serine/threonine protein kinase/serine/threonine-protein kinase